MPWRTNDFIVLISSRVTLPAGSAGRMSQCPMRVLASMYWPCFADCRVYERTTNNRVKPLWLPLTIDGLRAHYWPSDKRAYWQVAHRWAEHGTYFRPEYWTNHSVDHSASYYWPGKPADWIRAAEDWAHGSTIKRPATVQGNRARSPYPVVRHVRTMPKPPVWMVYLIPGRHSGSPPEEIRLVRISRWRWSVLQRQRQKAG